MTSTGRCVRVLPQDAPHLVFDLYLAASAILNLYFTAVGHHPVGCIDHYECSLGHRMLMKDEQIESCSQVLTDPSLVSADKSLM